MKITVEKEKITTFGNLKKGDVFILPNRESPDVYVKIPKVHEISNHFEEILLEGNAEAVELKDCEVNAYSLKSNQFVWFDPIDEVVEVEAELNVHR